MQPSAVRKPALGFIFVTLVLLMLGVGIIIPVLPGLVTQFKGGSIAEGSDTYGWLVGTFAVMQFVASPILGSLSDRYGRRKVILVALTGSAIDYVVMGLAPNMTWLFVARMISGATAGSLAACNAYIADVTPPEKRAQAYGLVGAAFGLGFVIGPAIGGLLGQISLRLPFFAAAGCVGINAVYGAFVLPESLPPENRRPFSWKPREPGGLPSGASALPRRRGPGLDVLHLQFREHDAPERLGPLHGLPLRLDDARGRPFPHLRRRDRRRRAGRPRQAHHRRGPGRGTGLVIGLLLSPLAMAGYGTVTKGWMFYCARLVWRPGRHSRARRAGAPYKARAPERAGRPAGFPLGPREPRPISSRPMLAAWSFGKCIAVGASWHLPGIAFYESSDSILVALALAFRSFQLDDRIAATA